MYKRQIQQILGTDVGGHNQDRILEIDSFAGRIRDTSIIQNLQQDVKYIRVRFLNLIEEDNGIRFAPYCLGQLTDVYKRQIYYQSIKNSLKQ